MATLIDAIETYTGEEVVVTVWVNQQLYCRIMGNLQVAEERQPNEKSLYMVSKYGNYLLFRGEDVQKVEENKIHVELSTDD